MNIDIIAELYTDCSYKPLCNRMKHASCLVINDKESFISDIIKEPRANFFKDATINWGELYSIKVALDTIRTQLKNNEIGINQINIYNDNDNVVHRLNNFLLKPRYFRGKKTPYKTLIKNTINKIKEFETLGITVNIMWIGESMDIPILTQVDRLTRTKQKITKFSNI